MPEGFFDAVGQLKINSSKSLHTAVVVATEVESAKRRPSRVVTVKLQLSFGLLKAFSDYTVEVRTSGKGSQASECKTFYWCVLFLGRWECYLSWGRTQNTLAVF